MGAKFSFLALLLTSYKLCLSSTVCYILLHSLSADVSSNMSWPGLSFLRFNSKAVRDYAPGASTHIDEQTVSSHKGTHNGVAPVGFAANNGTVVRRTDLSVSDVLSCSDLAASWMLTFA